MATASKAPAKSGAKQAAPAAPEVAEAPPKSNKKLIIILVAVLVLVLIGGGVGAWLLLSHKSAPAQEGGGSSHASEKSSESKSGPEKAPVFVVLEPFTVNLQAENGDQFLQTTFTLQVEDEKEVELFKQYMPQVRSRLLLLLSSKKASEINNREGKEKLSEEIIKAANEPFVAKGKPQHVSDVFYTSFVIQ